MIDDDEKRFTVEILKKWKKSAERIAGKEIGGALRSLLPALLIDHEICITRTDFERGMEEILKSFLDDCGALAAWGQKRYNATILLAYELTLNAFQHGSVDQVRITTKKGCLHIFHPGEKFGPEDLLQVDGQGGQAALRAFKEQCSGSLELIYRSDGGSNEWAIIDFSRGLNHHHPCGVRLGRNFDLTESTSRVRGCEEVHIYLGDRGIFSFSHAADLAKKLVKLLPERAYVFHGVDQNVHLRSFIASHLPNVKFFDSRIDS
ncbi:hypothetical protein ACFZBP_21865 [Streptomyces sp. NPDC008086]|uniref:hypothetical protein n=1 Tax=Streptomyces sp. NPDC008086 TaxID=3364807 RepID=UPI0036EE5DA3